MHRVVLFLFFLAAGFLSSHADATPMATRSGHAPAYVELHTAIAVHANGSARWASVTIPPDSSAVWFVPVRPGARVDWTDNVWLDALDSATRPVIELPPDGPCGPSTAVDRTDPWLRHRDVREPSQFELVTSVSEASRLATKLGYSLSYWEAETLGLLTDQGYDFVAVHLSEGGTSTTLRVIDSSGPNLSIVTAHHATTRVTAYTIGPGPTSNLATLDVAEREIYLRGTRSNYEEWRQAKLGATSWSTPARWLRESVSSLVLEQELQGPDLAIALNGLSPAKTVVTRWAAEIEPSILGNFRSFVFDANDHTRSVRVQARSTQFCGNHRSSQQTGQSSSSTYVESDGCSSSTPSSSRTWDTSSSSSSGGSSSEDSDGWDDSDDSSSEGCSGGDGWDSGDSSDGCSGTGDGWDDPDMSSRRKPKRGPSPVSRYALLGVALALPLRRWLRSHFSRRTS